MDILENQAAWRATYEANWLAHYKATGTINWDLYNRPDNRETPAGPGIDLSRSRLVLVSSAGGYLRDRQEPFDAENDLGDYTIRSFPVGTAPDAIAFAHTHYDHTAVNQDQQVLLPLGHLQNLADEGVVGELAPEVINFMGYQPDAARVVDETIPAVIAAAQAQNAQAALLVPS